MGDSASWDRVLDDAGPLAGLVNCAGIRTRGDIVNTSVAEFERHLRINVTGTWLGIRGFLRRHEVGAAGAIVNIASVNAEIAVAGQAHYVASKGAVAALTRAAAIEAAPLGVRVNAVAPGGIRTPMTAERLADPAQVAWFGERVPLGRVGEPGEGRRGGRVPAERAGLLHHRRGALRRRRLACPRLRMVRGALPATVEFAGPDEDGSLG